MPALTGSGFLFGEITKPAEVAGPHLAQDRLERAQRPRIRPIVAVGTGAPLPDEPAVFEQAQILRDRRPADIEGGRNLAGGALRCPDQAQDLAPSWIGDGLHGGLERNRATASSGLHFWIGLFKLLLN